MTRLASTLSALGIALFLAPTFWLLNEDSIPTVSAKPIAPLSHPPRDTISAVI
jgi:hypothetical protein